MNNLADEIIFFNENIDFKINNFNFVNLTKHLLKVVIDLSEKYNLNIHKNNLLSHIIFTSNPNLKFQVSEVSKVNIALNNDNSLTIYMEVNHFGLMGSSSPLPAHYIENAILHDNGNNILDFTNVLTNQLMKKMYKSYFKYIMTNSYQKGFTDKLSSYILYTLGIQAFKQEDYNWNVAKLVPYTGLLIMKLQSKKNILLILKHYFLHQDIEIFENMPCSTLIEKNQQNSLGIQNNILSQDLILGSKGYYINSKFMIDVFNLTWEKFLNFLPNGENWNPMKQVLDYALKKPLKYDMRLSLSPKEAKLSYLNKDNDVKLGWNTWLGTIPDNPQVLLTVKS